MHSDQNSMVQLTQPLHPPGGAANRSHQAVRNQSRQPAPHKPHEAIPHRSQEAVPLEALRQDIEALDRELVELVARRCQLARDAGTAKSISGLPLMDPAREAKVVRLSGRLARSRGLDEEAVRHIFWCLIGLARRSQASVSHVPDPTPATAGGPAGGAE